MALEFRIVVDIPLKTDKNLKGEYHMKKLFAIVLALCLVLALAATAFADWAPSGPVSIIVSFHRR